MPDTSDSIIVAPLWLRDLSFKDKSLDMHKRGSGIIQTYYGDFSSEINSEWREIFEKYSKRIANCANDLVFNIKVDDNENSTFRLKSAQFCRVRYCPMCQSRRATMNRTLMSKVTEKLIADYPNYRYLFLTLTVPNCDISDLRTTLAEMNKAFVRFTKLSRWPGVGWVKSTEVTKELGSYKAHPHFHCLIMVKPSYFSGKYYLKHDNRKKGKKSDWLDLWNQCNRSDNIEALHVTAIDKGDDKELKNSIFEVMKYGVKETDLCESKNWLFELTKQTHRLRFIDKGGVFKQYFREVKDEPRNLIHSNTNEDGTKKSFLEVKADEVHFRWDRRLNRYFCKS